jgi:hypothetical protein
MDEFRCRKICIFSCIRKEGKFFSVRVDDGMKIRLSVYCACWLDFALKFCFNIMSVYGSELAEGLVNLTCESSEFTLPAKVLEAEISVTRILGKPSEIFL